MRSMVHGPSYQSAVDIGSDDESAQPTTLVDVITRAAELNSGSIFVHGDRAARPATRDYRTLLEDARMRWRYLYHSGVRKDDYLVLQHDTTDEFLTTFWAAILGGAIAVPLPQATGGQRSMRLQSVLDTVNGRSFIVTETQPEKQSHGVPIIKTEKQSDVAAYKEATFAKPLPKDTAYIQFSSGSTGNPKGAILSHENVVANIRAITAKSGSHVNVALSWMPLSHDMSLVGFHLAPTLVAIDQHFMRPWTFLKRPTRWLDIISQYRVNAIASPTSGLQHLLSSLEKRAPEDLSPSSWDLSSVRLLFTGAESVSSNVCHKFVARLSQYGLEDNVVFPGYGLAEACLAVTLPVPLTPITQKTYQRASLVEGRSVAVATEDDESTTTLVTLGSPIAGCRVRIVDRDGDEVSDGVVGRIEVSGSNVTSGYLGQVDDPDVIVNGWLKTGDMGFMAGGHLTFTGRVKDVMSFYGQNYYAHELDEIATRCCGHHVACASVLGESGKETLVAFVQARGKKSFDALAKKIDHSLYRATGTHPLEVVRVDHIPRTTSGKVMRHALSLKLSRTTATFPSSADTQSPRPKQSIQEIFSRVTGLLDASTTTPLMELGVHSVTLADLASQIEAHTGVEITMADVLSHPTLEQLERFVTTKKRSDSYSSASTQAGHLMTAEQPRTPGASRNERGSPASASKHDTEQMIAIVGIGVQLNEIQNVNDLWSTLNQKKSVVRSFPRARQALIEPLFSGRTWPHGGYLDTIDAFDAAHFCLSDADAIRMHPSQRLTLETAALAFADAGYSKTDLDGSQTGVYVGVLGDLDMTVYREFLARDPGAAGTLAIAGNLSTFTPGRIAYTYNLKGPTMAIDTACSASLVAVHTASQALRTGECDMALAGGVRVSIVPSRDQIQAGFESRTGTIRPFDADADGTVAGEGGAMVVLKRMSNALSDGDRIYACIAGSAVNHDGASASVMAPNPKAQTNVIKRAWKNSGLDPRRLAFVEAHGTGTPIGDPLEVEALTRAFTETLTEMNLGAAQVQGSCALGTIKANFGHLFEGAGVVGLTKAALSLKERAFPPAMGYVRPNPALNIDKTPFYINQTLAKLGPKSDVHTHAANSIDAEDNPTHDDDVLWGAVSSFGLSGTNCHVVLRSPPIREHALREIRQPLRLDLKRKSYWVSATRPHTGANSEIDNRSPTQALSKTEVHALLREAFLEHGDLDLGDDRKQRLYALGVDSMVVLQVRQVVQDALGIELATETLLEETITLEELIDTIVSLIRTRAESVESARPASTTPPLSPVKSASAQPTTSPSTEKAIDFEVEPKPNPARAQFEEDLSDLLSARTPTTKQSTQEMRRVLACNRNSAGFRQSLKEIAYPIQVERARGGRFWDRDGNEYVDLTMGFGVHLFGHNPDFIRERIAEEVAHGFALGPMNPEAGKAAQAISSLTGVERVSFFNSGTEAVMVALRLARAVTKRDKVVLFAGSYHGTFDGVLGLRSGTRAIPAAPGTPRAMLQDVVILQYGTEEALDYIRTHANSLAAVLIEPVQSRHPDVVPQAFVQEVRTITEKSGSALIFDEMITGFRVGPGGMQTRWNIRADLVTYGKVAGGGLPIGIVAGKSRFMDAIDGGQWSFGDASLPTTEQTFVAGTFCHHPLAMVASQAVMQQLQKEGPRLQESLESKAHALQVKLNAELRDRDIPIVVKQFSSMLRIEPALASEVFFAKLLAEGVYVWEGRTSFVSTAHSHEDLEHVFRAVIAAAEALQAAGFFGRPTISTPPNQLTRRRMKTSRSGATHTQAADILCGTFKLEGPVDADKLAGAVVPAFARHEASRIRCLTPEGITLGRLPHVDLKVDRLSAGDPKITETRAWETISKARALPFDFTNGPFFRVRIVWQQTVTFVSIIAHRNICDGWSLSVLVRDLLHGYRCRLRGTPPKYALATAWSALAESINERWQHEPIEAALPAIEADQKVHKLDTLAREEAVACAKATGANLLSLLLAAAAKAWHETKETTASVVILVPVASQPLMDALDVVGACSELIAVEVANPQESLGKVAQGLAGQIRRSLADPRSHNHPKHYDFVFNLDRLPAPEIIGNAQVKYVTSPVVATVHPAVINVVDDGQVLIVEWKIARGQSLDAVCDRYRQILESLPDHSRRKTKKIPDRIISQQQG